MVLVLMMMRVRCVGGLTPLLLVLVVMIEGCLGGAGIGVLVAAKVKICVLVEISGLL